MELSEYGRILWRRGWIIALATAIGLVLSLLFARLQPVIYRAEATLQVSPAVMSYSVVLTAKLLLQQFASQIETTRTAQEVLQRVPLEGVKPPELLEHIEVTTVPEDFLLRIDADFLDGSTAMRVADAFAETFVTFHAQRQQTVDPLDRIEILVLSHARKYWQDWPRTRILAGVGGLLGLILGTLGALALEYRGAGVIRSAQDAEQIAGLPVLGAIPGGAQPGR
ncbi:MAG: hypothetical protein HYZ68_04130 [Chloroflexi bacterium]|nr:hypothetical protein [Chloroflexota bacterium]